jgi:hypothetical protein
MASIDKFLASDIAWLASGASTDGQHDVAANRFFQEFEDLRNATARGSPGMYMLLQDTVSLTTSEGSTDRKAFAELVRRLIFDLVRGCLFHEIGFLNCIHIGDKAGSCYW